MTQLTMATRPKPGSLYGAFRSKEALFRETLDLYGVRSVQTTRTTLANAASPMAGIRAWVTHIAREVVESATPGCLLVNTAMENARHHETVRVTIHDHLGEIRRLLAQTLAQAKACGEIPENKDPEALAAFLLCTIWGLRILGQIDLATRDVASATRALLETLTI